VYMFSLTSTIRLKVCGNCPKCDATRSCACTCDHVYHTNESRHERVTSRTSHVIHIYVLLWIMYTMYICVYIYIPNAPCICISMSNTIKYGYIYIYVQTCMHMCVCVCMCARVCECLCACVYICVYLLFLACEGHVSFTCGTWCIHMWDMTHSHVGHDLFTRGT